MMTFNTINILVIFLFVMNLIMNINDKYYTKSNLFVFAAQIAQEMYTMPIIDIIGTYT